MKFYTPIKDYNFFKEEIENKMRDKNISMNNNPCYLIKDNLVNDFINSENKRKERRSNKRSLSLGISQNKKSEFLNDFESVINYLKEKNLFKMINNELLGLTFKEYELKKNNFVNYYTGNNKIIIKYNSYNEKYALLIFNSISYYNERDIYIINLYDNYKENKELFIGILQNFYPNLIDNDIYQDIIIQFDAFICNKDFEFSDTIYYNNIRKNNINNYKAIYPRNIDKFSNTITGLRNAPIKKKNQ